MTIKAPVYVLILFSSLLPVILKKLCIIFKLYISITYIQNLDYRKNIYFVQKKREKKKYNIGNKSHVNSLDETKKVI